jgi:hypothetical protein
MTPRPSPEDQVRMAVREYVLAAVRNGLSLSVAPGADLDKAAEHAVGAVHYRTADVNLAIEGAFARVREAWAAHFDEQAKRQRAEVAAPMLHLRAMNGDSQAVWEHVAFSKHVKGMRRVKAGMLVTFRALHPAEVVAMLDALDALSTETKS